MSTCVNSQVVLNSYNKAQSFYNNSSNTGGGERAPGEHRSSNSRGGGSGGGGEIRGEREIGARDGKREGPMRGSTRGGGAGRGGGGYNSDRSATSANGPGGVNSTSGGPPGTIAGGGGRGRGRGRPTDGGSQHYTKPPGVGAGPGVDSDKPGGYSKSSSYSSRTAGSSNWDDKYGNNRVFSIRSE